MITYNHSGSDIEQRGFTLVLKAGDELQHINGPCDLYGFRLGDL